MVKIDLQNYEIMIFLVILLYYIYKGIKIFSL